LITQLIDGSIQKKISESAAKEQELFDNGKKCCWVPTNTPTRTIR